METLGFIPMAPASSWMWLWVRPLHPPTVSPRRHQMSPRTPRRMRRRPHQRHRRRDDADQDPAIPRLPGQSFAIEHRVREKKNKFRLFLGADVDDPRRFVPFVFIGSFRTTWNCGGSLSGVCTYVLSAIFRYFVVSVPSSVISVI